MERKIIDLEWPTRYVLECGHEVAIGPEASVADMAMPGQFLPCGHCSGVASPEPPPLITRFKAGEAINAITLNRRLAEIESQLGAEVPPFAADEPINAETLNKRLDVISRHLAR